LIYNERDWRTRQYQLSHFVGSDQIFIENGTCLSTIGVRPSSCVSPTTSHTTFKHNILSHVLSITLKLINC